MKIDTKQLVEQLNKATTAKINTIANSNYSSSHIVLLRETLSSKAHTAMLAIGRIEKAASQVDELIQKLTEE